MWKYFFKKPSDQFWAIFKDKLSKNVLILGIYVGNNLFFRILYQCVCMCSTASKKGTISEFHLYTYKSM